MPERCQARHCRNEKGRSSVSFHRFPLKNKDLTTQWLEGIGRPDFVPSAKAVVCSAHFDDAHVRRKGRNASVLRHAVPRIERRNGASDNSVRRTLVQAKLLNHAFSNAANGSDDVIPAKRRKGENRECAQIPNRPSPGGLTAELHKTPSSSASRISVGLTTPFTYNHHPCLYNHHSSWYNHLFKYDGVPFSSMYAKASQTAMSVLPEPTHVHRSLMDVQTSQTTMRVQKTILGFRSEMPDGLWRLSAS